MTGKAPDIRAQRVNTQRDILLIQTRTLDALIHQVVEKTNAPDGDLAEIARTTMLMLQALGVSIHSVLKLTEEREMSIRDCYGIARASVELAMNICYIAAGGVEIARRAQRHAFQKSYRDLDRTIKLGSLVIELRRDNRPNVSDFPGLEDALREFTGAKGQELTDWTPHNLSKRIAVIEGVSKQAALSLSGAIASIYRHSSELIHGTYFGVQHFWQGSSGRAATTRERFAEVWEEHFQAIFNGLFFATNGIAELFVKVFGLPEFSPSQTELLSRLEAAVTNA